VISRVADHLFWLGRYLERAESTARVLAVTRNLSLDGELEGRQAWLPAVVVFGEEARFRARRGEDAFADGDEVQRYLTWEEDAASIAQAIRAARENARSIRDVVSLETWESVNELHLWLAGAGRDAWEQDRHGFYRSVRDAVQRTHGVVHGTMLHDDAFDFLFLGVMLERAGQTARTLDVHHHALAGAHQVVETAVWLALLRACSGFEPYMKRFQGQASVGSVARFLVLDARFPRSVVHCLHDAAGRLARVRPSAADLQGRSLQRLRELEARVLDETGPAIDGAALHALLTHVVDESHLICGEIGRELLGDPAPVAAAAAVGAAPAPAQ
jgi:uncharacterized alpha-E superfamily protein